MKSRTLSSVRAAPFPPQPSLPAAARAPEPRLCRVGYRPAQSPAPPSPAPIVLHARADDLYDMAIEQSVPTSDWGEFCRIQMPSPRMDEADDDDWAAPAEDGKAHSVTYEVQGEDGAVKKVRKAMARAVKLVGWRAKLPDVQCTFRTTGDHFGMDEPDEAPAPDGATDVSDPPPLYGGHSLHGDVEAHAARAADAHLGLLSLTEPEPRGAEAETIMAQVSERAGESRAQRYSRALRKRMEEREQGRKGPG